MEPVSTPLEPGKHFQELPDDENPTNTNEYQKLIGCLTYVTTATRPDPVAKPVRQFSHAMQILNHYHYSFL